MLQVDVEKLKEGADAIEQSTRNAMRLLAELECLAQGLQSCTEQKLQEPLSDMTKTLEETGYLISAMSQLYNVLRLAEYQYGMAAQTTLLHCENSCLTGREKEFRTVSLRKIRKKMSDIKFGKGIFNGTDYD